MTDQLSLLLATGLYSGMLPPAPGFWGTALGLLLWYLCRNLASPTYFIIAVGLFAVGAWAAGQTERILDQVDAKRIVIDETLGSFIALAGASKMRFGWLWGCLLFLFLDFAKPFPASWIDANLPSGLGVMMDDVVVGFYSLFVLLFWSRFVTRKTCP